MLDRLLETVAERTEAVAGHLTEVSYEELEQLADLRDRLTAEIEAGAVLHSLGNKALVERIIRHDEAIVERMRQLRDEAAEHLRKIRWSNAQKNVYEAKGSIGGFMFDHKK